MCEYKKHERFIIHSYKHNGNIHRAWDEAILLDDCGDYLVFGNDRTKVLESDGRSWRIGQLKQDGIYYYCNMASPFIIEDGAIKYIDYDLDLRVFPDGAFKVLDRGEYKYHKNKMKYPEAIDEILKSELTNLISLVRAKVIPFDKKTIEYYYNLYNKVKGEITN